MAVTLESPRELRGLEILAKGDQIRRVNADTYRVKSQNASGSYLVVRSGKEWTCECPDHNHRQTVCKHIWSVYFSLNLRQRVVTQVQPQIEDKHEEGCRVCGSDRIVKIGKIHTKHGDVQRYLCNECNRKFVDNETGFEYVKATPKAITVALDCYFKGMSQRKIVEHLRIVEGVKVTQPAVLKWIRKYMELMKGYCDKFTPQLGGIWHADETAVNIRRTEPIRVGMKSQEGYFSWMWNLMDHETRFLIASEVTKHRYVEDAKKVLKKAKDVSGGERPDFIVTDKLPAYRDGIKKTFFTQDVPRTKHVRIKSIRKGTNTKPIQTNNNIIERLHGTIKERTKVMRGLNDDANAKAMLESNALYYNYLRPHQGIEGKTPAEKAGIDLKLEGNKWQELIKRGACSKSKAKNSE